MPIAQLPLFSALADKMRWHQTRQTLLAENVANAETPGYRGSDLAAFEPAATSNRLSLATVATTTTASGHFSVASQGSPFEVRGLNSFEVTPEGNGVTLEDEMMKVTANQLDYQTATALYSRSIKILKTALGRSA